MPTFQRCEKSVDTAANQLLNKFETHKPLLIAEVKIDFVFAFADKDEKTGAPLNDALTHNGIKALGVARKIPLKDRALGRGDAEIALDGDHWAKCTAEEQDALLDHELHHIAVKMDRQGNIQYDDLGRPLIVLRKHDVEVGWFKCVAERHGLASVERIQARAIMDNVGQYFWPDIAPRLTISTGKTSVTVPVGALAKAAAISASKRPHA